MMAEEKFPSLNAKIWFSTDVGLFRVNYVLRHT